MRFLLFFLSLLCGVALYTGYKVYFVHPKPPVHKEQLLPSKFSLEHAPSGSLRGTVTPLAGEVAIQSRIATEAARIVAAIPIQQGEEVETGPDGSAQIEISGMTYTMAADAHIALVQTLPTSTVIRQQYGKVTYENSKSKPLTIRALHLLSKVASGSAVVTVVPDTAEATVTVQSGKVTVGFTSTDNITNLLTITEGERYIFDDTSREGTVKALRK